MDKRNIRLTVEYDGTRYFGWQSPKKESSSTIAGRIEEVLRKMTGEEITLFCAEKTEPGVHAVRQEVNFKTESRMSATEIRQYLNRYLPLDISVCSAEEAAGRFHAELNPHTVTYRYRILVGDTSDVFQRKYVDFRTEMPDTERMVKGAKRLMGSHDFQAFSAGKTKKSTVREITDIKILESTAKDHVEILFSADRFLKQMPQKLIGTLLDIGDKTRECSCIDRIFEGDEAASAGCVNHALFLEHVIYC